MNFMDKLPRVKNCCFCCFLRAGTVMIALISFIFGALFAPNLTHSSGYWDMNALLSSYSAITELTIQMILGLASIVLCLISASLFIGAICRLPSLIEIYQWGIIVYSGIVVFTFFTLSVLCFFVHNSYVAGSVLCALILSNILFTFYFLIVTNSLRISIKQELRTSNSAI